MPLGKRKRSYGSGSKYPKKKIARTTGASRRGPGYTRYGVGMYSNRFNTPAVARKPERKFIDSYRHLEDATDARKSALVVPSMFFCKQGAGASQRLGMKIFAEKFTFRYSITAKTHEVDKEVNIIPEFRVLIVHDTQANGTVPEITEVLTTESWNTTVSNAAPVAIDSSIVRNPMNIANSRRFRILHDKVHCLSQVIAQTTTVPSAAAKVVRVFNSQKVDKTKNLKFEIEYSDVAADGWVSSLKSNNIFVYVLSYQSFNVTAPVLDFMSRVRYTDS